jgi:hydrogenase nickel incorporation protein HypA/HybF
MHELTLTESVVEIATEAAEQSGARSIRRIVLEIGKLSAVEPEAMRFCFDAVAVNTAAAGAALEICSIEGAGWCADCARTVALDERVSPCPECGGFRIRITAGEEMRVRELEIV